jgi:hypothetical protein
MRLRQINEGLLSVKIRDAIAWDRPYTTNGERPIEPSSGHENSGQPPLTGVNFRRRGRKPKTLELRPGTIRL